MLLQLGIGSTVDQHAPSFVSSLNMGVLCVSLGQDLSCAINIYGKLYCWGYNFKNQVGSLVVASFVVAPVPNHSRNICSSAIIQAFLPVALSANFSVVSAGSVSRVLRLQRLQLRLRLKHSVGL